jgi:hypothetical protein
MNDWIKHKRYNPEEQGYGNKEQWIRSFYKKFNYKDFRETSSSKFKGTEGEIEERYMNCRTYDELKKVFRELVMKYHPDRNGQTEENNYLTGFAISLFHKIKYKFI